MMHKMLEEIEEVAIDALNQTLANESSEIHEHEAEGSFLFFFVFNFQIPCFLDSKIEEFEEEGIPNEVYIVFFLFCTLLLGAICRLINKKWGVILKLKTKN